MGYVGTWGSLELPLGRTTWVVQPLSWMLGHLIHFHPSCSSETKRHSVPPLYSFLYYYLTPMKIPVNFKQPSNFSQCYNGKNRVLSREKQALKF